MLLYLFVIFSRIYSRMSLPVRFLAEGLIAGEWVCPPGPCIFGPGHVHNDLEVSLLESGRLQIVYGGKRYELKPGAPMMFWALRAHGIVEAEAGTRALFLHVPFATVLQWSVPESFWSWFVSGQALTVPQELQSGATNGLREWVRELELRTPTGRRIALLEIHALCERVGRVLANRRLDRHNFLTRPVPGGAVDRMLGFAVQNYLNPTTLSELARVGKMTPNSAVRAFRRTIGITPGYFLSQCRISHAQSLLRTTDAKVTDIALEAGFSSLSRFYATFAKLVGLAPGRYRSLWLENDEISPPLPGDALLG
jgi:AraC family transcriptional regulator, melibiose operon regulatory protein